MGYHGEVGVVFDGFGAEGDVGDVVWGGLGEDAAEAAAGFGEVGVVFAPELEFRVAAYGGEELAEEGREPLDLWGRVSMGFCLLGGMDMWDVHLVFRHRDRAMRLLGSRSPRHLYRRL